jgi:hypothetical protein
MLTARFADSDIAFGFKQGRIGLRSLRPFCPDERTRMVRGPFRVSKAVIP